MSVTVTERKLDEKRRVTIPSNVSFKEGSKVVMIAFDDAAIIASDEVTAKRLARVLREAQTACKLRALDEWVDLVEKAGLSKIKAGEIDAAVERGLTRPKRLNA